MLDEDDDDDWMIEPIPVDRWKMHPIAPDFVEDQVMSLVYNNGGLDDATWLAERMCDWARFLPRGEFGSWEYLERERVYNFWRGMHNALRATAQAAQFTRDRAKHERKIQMIHGPKKRVRHMQSGADSCACGNVWPCSRTRRKS